MATAEKTPKNVYPLPADQRRIDQYQYYDKIFGGEHYDAFAVKAERDFTERYARLKYIAANFGGLVSKVISDILFGEEVKMSMPKGSNKAGQEWLEAFIKENGLNIQNYESSLANSRRGDALFRLRIGPRNPGVLDDKATVIVEDINPMCYFPVLNDQNIRLAPKEEVLGSCLEIDGKYFYHKEIHTPGMIVNRVWDYKKDTKELGVELSPEAVKAMGFEPAQETKVKRSLLFHVPNFKDGSSYWGISDYKDLISLFYALNNRLSKVDNILDKHSDPVLAVPDSVLDEKGEIRKEAFGLITLSGDDQKPEYIIWDANMDAAFKEIDKIVEFLFMFSETSPDVLGLGQGKSDSGRALKLRMLRTLAKAKRKQVYYEQALKELLKTAMELSKAHKAEVGGAVFAGEPDEPIFDWPDGVINDTREAAEEEEIRLRSGTTSVKDAIMRLDGVSESEAAEKVKAINEESGLGLGVTPPTNDPTKLVDPNNPNTNPKPTTPAVPAKPQPKPQPAPVK